MTTRSVTALLIVALLAGAGCGEASGGGGSSTSDNGSPEAAKFAFKDVAHKLADNQFLNYRLQDTNCQRSSSHQYIYLCTATIMADDGPHEVSGRVNWRSGNETAHWDD